MNPTCQANGWDASARVWRGLTQEFSATRAIGEYTESHYLPAASRYRDRAADDGALGSSLLQWKQELDRHWSAVRFVGHSESTPTMGSTSSKPTLRLDSSHRIT